MIRNGLFKCIWAKHVLKIYYCHIWNQHPEICWKWVFNPYIEFLYRPTFWGQNLKMILSYLKSTPSNLSNYKNFVKKWKYLNLWSEMVYLSAFGLNIFLKFIIVIFGISTLKYVENGFLILTLNFCIGPLFGARIWKWYCHIWNQHPRICLITKILWKNENT